MLANGNEYLGVGDLPEELKELTIPSDGPRIGSFHEAVQGFKKELVRSALRMHSGNKLKAAIELGISRCYLHRLLNQFDLVDENAAGREVEEEEGEPEFPGYKEPRSESNRMAVRITYTCST